MSQKLLLTTALLCLALIMLYALFGDQFKSSKPVPSVSIAVSKTPLSAPIYIADMKGFFDPSCAQVKLHEVIGGKRAFESLVKGESDFATSSDSVMVFEGLKRNDFVNLASFVQSDNDVKLITLKDSGINEYHDFLEKKVAVTKGTSGEYLLSLYLALGGLSLDDINLISLPPEKMQQAVLEKQADIVVTWEPFVFNILKSSSEKVKILPSKNLYTLTFNLLAKKGKSADHSSAVCVLQGLKKAIEFIATNQEQSQNILVEKLSIEPSFINWVWQDYIFQLSLNRSFISDLETQAEWAIQNNAGTTKAVPNFTTLINPKPLKQVEPLAVKLL